MESVVPVPEPEYSVQLDSLRQQGDGEAGVKEEVANSVLHDVSVPICDCNDCPLCSLDEEYIGAEEGGWTVVSAEGGPGDSGKGWDSGLKGHYVRNLVVYEDHGELVQPFQDFNFAEFLLEETAEDILESEQVEAEDCYVALFGSMASVDDHFHLVASDLKSRNGAEPDLDYVDSYFLYKIDDGELEFEEARTSDFYGIYMQSMLEEDLEEINIDMSERENVSLEEKIERAEEDIGARAYAEALAGS